MVVRKDEVQKTDDYVDVMKGVDFHSRTVERSLKTRGRAGEMEGYDGFKSGCDLKRGFGDEVVKEMISECCTRENGNLRGYQQEEKIVRLDESCSWMRERQS